MRVSLVNPHTLIQPGDPLTTGIYYFPITLAYLAASLREAVHTVRVIDAVGKSPTTVRRWQTWWIQGLPMEDVLERVAREADDAVFVYAGNLVSHEATMKILQGIAQRCPDRPRIVVENTQAVTAYALKKVLPEIFRAGATYVLTGECERRAVRLLETLSRKDDLKSLDGIYS